MRHVILNYEASMIGHVHRILDVVEKVAMISKGATARVESLEKEFVDFKEGIEARINSLDSANFKEGTEARMESLEKEFGNFKSLTVNSIARKRKIKRKTRWCKEIK